MKKLFILQLRDARGNYDDVNVKVYADGIDEIQSRLESINLNEAIKEYGFSDDDFDFDVASYYAIDLMFEIK